MNTKCLLRLQNQSFFYLELVRRIQLRLIAVIQACEYRNKPIKMSPVTKPRGPTLTELRDRSQHKTYIVDGFVNCVSCSARIHNKSCILKDWLASECFPAPPTDPLKPLGIQLSIGNRVTHVSHNMTLYKGLAVCIKCGNFGSVRLRNLASRCEGVPNKYGKDVLEALQHDKFPKNVTRWPEDAPVHSCLFGEENRARLKRKHDIFEAEVIEELEANLNAGIASSSTGPDYTVPIADASSSLNPREPNLSHAPELIASHIVHGFDEDEMSQQSEPSDY